MPCGVGRIVYEEIKLVRGSTLGWFQLSNEECTGSKMVMSQGFITLWLSTADMPRQPRVSAYGHRQTHWYESTLAHCSLFCNCTCRLRSQPRQVELVVWAAWLQLVPTQGCQSCGRCSVSVAAFLGSAHRHQLKGTAVLWRQNSIRSVWHSWALLGHCRCMYQNTHRG